MCPRCVTRASSSQGQGTIFLGGPPLVKAATGESVSPPKTWAAPRCIRSISGVTDHMARDDLHALQLARRAVRNLNRQSNAIRDPCPSRLLPRNTTRPSWPGSRPSICEKPCDVREIIARIVDGSEFDEFQTPVRRNSLVSVASRTFTAIPSASSPTTASLFSARARKRARTLSSCARQREVSLWSSCKTFRRLHGRQKVRAGRYRQRRRQRWSPPLRAPTCLSSPSSSGAALVPATIPCAVGPTRPGFCGCGRTPGYLGDGRRAGGHVCLATVRRDGIEGRKARSGAKKDEAAFKERRSVRTVRTPGPSILCQCQAVG